MEITKILPLVLCALSLSMGGVAFTVRVENLDEKKPPALQHTWLEKDRMRMNMQTGTEEHAFLYREDKDAMYMISPAQKSYMEMTRADMKKAGERMDQAMAKMKEAMKNMPPEQKAMMEKMMGGRMPLDSVLPTDYKKTGKGKVGAWATTEYDGFRGGKKVSHVSVADYGTVGLTPDDFAIHKSLETFFTGLHMGHLEDYFKQVDQLKGLPVRTVTFDEAGKEKMKVEVQEVKKEGIPASQFDLPAGYEKKKMEIPDLGEKESGPHGSP